MPYLRGFIPEGQIVMVKVGQQVYLDSFPEQPLLAKVTRVDPKASFTPENTYFQRPSYQVFGVELTSKIPRLAKLACPPMVESYQRRSQNAPHCCSCSGVSKTMTEIQATTATALKACDLSRDLRHCYGKQDNEAVAVSAWTSMRSLG